jgi:UDPglucose 6-dehydrogenase
MRILIIGHGYVGKAISSIFSKTEKDIIDPKYNKLTIKDVSTRKYDLVFVCVDTPRGNKFKTLNSVLNELNVLMSKNTVVCCKSTAPPYFYGNAEKRYSNINIVYSPEYLSHHSNIKDFQSQTFLILGGKLNGCKKIACILKSKIKSLNIIKYTDIKTAALIKYAENAFLAYKITFFNELFDIHKKLNLKSSFNNIIELMTLDYRIGSSHTQVPGRDGLRGWGGHCFEKDNMEFQAFTGSKLIKFMRKINKLHRLK